MLLLVVSSDRRHGTRVFRVSPHLGDMAGFCDNTPGEFSAYVYFGY